MAKQRSSAASSFTALRRSSFAADPPSPLHAEGCTAPPTQPTRPPEREQNSHYHVDRAGPSPRVVRYAYSPLQEWALGTRTQRTWRRMSATTV